MVWHSLNGWDNARWLETGCVNDMMSGTFSYTYDQPNAINHRQVKSTEPAIVYNHIWTSEPAIHITRLKTQYASLCIVHILYIHTCLRAWVFQLKHMHALGFSRFVQNTCFFRKTSTLPSGAANRAFHHVLRCDISIAHRCDGVTSLGPGSTDVMRFATSFGSSQLLHQSTHTSVYTHIGSNIFTQINIRKNISMCENMCFYILCM